MEMKEKIIKAIKEDGVNIGDLAKKLYISERQLKSLVSSWGVELVKKRKKVEVPSRLELMELYNKLGNTMKLSEHYGVGINTVNRWLRSHNIPTRKLNNMSDEQKVNYLE